jgi:multiple sugar transport system permease protein
MQASSPRTAAPMRRRKLRKTGWTALIVFLAPTVVAFLVFNYYPLLKTVYMSFFNYDAIKPPGPFVGFLNYPQSFKSASFRTALSNTVVLFLFSLGFGFWVPILQALLLDSIRGAVHRVSKYLYLLPMAIPSVGVYLVWIWIWHPDLGLANALLKALHLPILLWLTDPKLVKMCLRIPMLLGGGMSILIYLAAIQGVPADQYESAELDGAGLLRRLWHITLPNIWHMVTILFILTLTGALLAFDDIFVMTQGGPGDASTTLVFGVYRIAFNQLQMGQGAAWAVLILLITLAATSVQLWLTREERK